MASSKAKKHEEKRMLREADLAFYLSIWKMGKRRCFVTGKYLGSELLTVFFHHILPKARFPEYRHCEWNIVLVSMEVHAQIEMNIDLVPVVKQLSTELMERHHNGELKSCSNG